MSIYFLIRSKNAIAEKVDEVYNYGSFMENEGEGKRMKSLDISEINKDLSQLSIVPEDLRGRKSMSHRDN